MKFEAPLPTALSEVRIDTHVHSRASLPPNSWLMDAVNVAESYTPPGQVYEQCKKRGMHLVTLTDHDSIDGILELRMEHPDDTFISVEVTTSFPEDGCLFHTVALDITEAQFSEIQRLRSNVYDLVRYFDRENIPSFACHPLSHVGTRLGPSHIQRCLLMFRGLEIRNGTRDPLHEQAIYKIVAGLSREKLAAWADAHPQAPFLNREGHYAYFGGSDDHAGLSMARAYTAFNGAATVAAFREAIGRSQTRPGGETATPDLLSHNIYGVTTAALLHSGQLSFGLGAGGQSGGSLDRTLARYRSYLDESDYQFDIANAIERGHENDTHVQVQAILDRILLRAQREAVQTLANAVKNGELSSAADAMPDVLKSLAFAIPYLSGTSVFARDAQEARAQSRELGFPLEESANPRIAILSDTLDDLHGVALGLRRLATQAQGEGRDLRLVGLGQGEQTSVDADGVVRIPCLLWHRLKVYPTLAFGIPHPTSLLRYLVTEKINLVQCSTPGPMGFLGLLAARMAGIPVVGQYHTDLPEYVTRLMGDPGLGNLVGRLVGWFYRQHDQVLAPSLSVEKRLLALGISPEKIRRVPRGIDHALFRPDRREAEAFSEFGLNGEPKIIYVGRLSMEKGLDHLLDGFRSTAGELPLARLLLVGDGPHAQFLRQKAADDPRVVFTGSQTGRKLARMYASADIFVSPSETETFGNTVVEAQAAGIPVVVANRGAAHEQMIPGETGLMVEANRPEALAAAIRLLLEKPELRHRMGRAAHVHAQRFRMESALEGTFDLYVSLLAEARAQSEKATHL